MSIKAEELLAITPEAIAAKIDEHLKQIGKSRSAFGWDLVRDTNLVFQLHKGRNITLRLVRKIFDELNNK